MYAQLSHLDGPAEGHHRVSSRDFITIGRHADSDVPFDPALDLQVSVRHAAIFKQGGGFMVRDLGSSNGTFLNGRRVRGDLPLEPDDVLQFGPTGPRLRFSVVDVLPPVGDAGRIEPAPEPNPRFRRSRPRTTERMAIPTPPRRSKRWRWVLAVGLAGVAVLAARLAQTRQANLAFERERSMLLNRVEDLAARLERARSPVPGVSAALSAAGRDLSSLRSELGAAAVGTVALDSMGAALDRTAERLQALFRVAAAEPDAWFDPVLGSVAALLVEGPTGTIRSGGGLVVAATSDSAWILTPRHLVVDSTGLPPIRIALALRGRAEVILGRLARVVDSADLALVSVRVRGGAPSAPLGSGPAENDAVAVAGFSGPPDALPDWRSTGARPAALAATVSAVGSGHVVLETYGQPVPAGAPIVDSGGKVIGMLTDTVARRGPDADAIRALLLIPSTGQ